MPRAALSKMRTRRGPGGGVWTGAVRLHFSAGTATDLPSRTAAVSYRRFTDSEGTPWRVWEVVPHPVDRRRGLRRIQVMKIHHAERRVLACRRVDMRRSRLYFPPSETPWLAFESGDERRRLRPVPQAWWLQDDAGLERLCAMAEPQRVTAGR